MVSEITCRVVGLRHGKLGIIATSWSPISSDDRSGKRCFRNSLTPMSLQDYQRLSVRKSDGVLVTCMLKSAEKLWRRMSRYSRDLPALESLYHDPQEDRNSITVSQEYRI